MTMRTCSVSFALILLLSAFASACSDSPTSPSTASAASSSSNAASSSTNVAAQLECGWTLTSIQPAGLPRQDRPAEAAYSITVSDGRLSTRADCNMCNGSFSVSDSTLTTASVLACTRAACPTMEFESAYTRLLSGESNILIAGNTLTLSSARGVLTFTR
jgi:heat shock protein HslJ